MAVYLARHGERIDFVDKSWVDSAARPFDPPLTARGVLQGSALGKRLSLLSPRPTKIFVSPLGRTVQTAAAAAAELGITALHVEGGLVEVLDEEWYRCWRCKPEDIRGDANAATLFLSPAELKSTVSNLVDTSYSSFYDVHSVGATRTSAEDWEGCTRRMSATIQAIVAAHPQDVCLFVSHGGPIEVTLPALDPRLPRRVKVDYTSLSAFTIASSVYTCTIHSDASHIDNVTVGVEDAVPGQ